METVIIVEKSSKHFATFMSLLQENPIIRIKELKKKIPRSSYYCVLIQRIFSLNKILRELNPDIYLAEPYFDIAHNKEVFTVLKKCDAIQIESKKHHYIIRMKK